MLDAYHCDKRRELIIICGVCRLEHSLGVAHLASTLANKFYRMQRRELDVRPEDVKVAEVAGA